MSFFPGHDPDPGDAAASDQIEVMVLAGVKDIGGIEVRRALPTAKRRLVGPFIFFDRMGPAILRPGQALDVKPHPHIGLATVTYLFDGRIRHRDSLGTEMVIAPGDVNLMTAGRGIVHSERTPEELRATGGSLSGLQTWLALPETKEEAAPSFDNTPGSMLPRFDADGVSGRVVIGAFEGLRSPVRTASDTLYADIVLQAGSSTRIPADAEERAIYILDGSVSIGGEVFGPDRLLVFRPGDEIVVLSERGAHFMLFGGASLGSRRYIWWNFVSSSRERIEQAKEEWKSGRFDIVPGDEEEFVPLPES
jgi:redox-sensitive bicupin YhaK (pirin superfamily)